MKIQKILFSFAIVCFVLTGCKNEAKKETVAVDKQNVSLAISGMTCEIGCAKTIQSKLSKKEGVLNAKVIFTDSIANIEYDANTTSKKDLVAFVDGIAGGELYKASITSKKGGKNCSETCKEKCTTKNGTKKECTGDKKCDPKKECKKTESASKECKPDCTMACCKNKKEATKKECKEDCKMECCKDKKA